MNKKTRMIFFRILLILPFLGIFTGMVFQIVGFSTIYYRDDLISVSNDYVINEYTGKRSGVIEITPTPGIATDMGMILVHGWTGNRFHWISIGSALASSGIHVVIMDQNGHGDATGGLDYDSLTFANSVLASWKFLTRHSNIENVAVMGHSMGGRAVTRFMMEYPDLVNATVVLGATMPYIGGDLSNSTVKNTLFLTAINDELFSPASLLETIRTTTNNSTAALEIQYGTFLDGSARMGIVIDNPIASLTHGPEEYHPDALHYALDWVNRTAVWRGSTYQCSSDQQELRVTEMLNANSYIATHKVLLQILIFSLVLLLIGTFLTSKNTVKINEKQNKISETPKSLNLKFIWISNLIVSITSLGGAMGYRLLSLLPYPSSIGNYSYFMEFLSIIVGYGVGILILAFIPSFQGIINPFKRIKQLKGKKQIPVMISAIVIGIFTPAYITFSQRIFHMDSGTWGIPMNWVKICLWLLTGVITYFVFLPEENMARRIQIQIWENNVPSPRVQLKNKIKFILTNIGSKMILIISMVLYLWFKPGELLHNYIPYISLIVLILLQLAGRFVLYRTFRDPRINLLWSIPYALWMYLLNAPFFV